MSLERTLLNAISEINDRLDCLEELLLERSPESTVFAKEWYNVGEVARETQSSGVRRYAAWTIRQACNSGRITDAQRGDNGHWKIPSAALKRILEHGLPPE